MRISECASVCETQKKKRTHIKCVLPWRGNLIASKTSSWLPSPKSTLDQINRVTLAIHAKGTGSILPFPLFSPLASHYVSSPTRTRRAREPAEFDPRTTSTPKASKYTQLAQKCCQNQNEAFKESPRQRRFWDFFDNSDVVTLYQGVSFLKGVVGCTLCTFNDKIDNTFSNIGEHPSLSILRCTAANIPLHKKRSEG